MIYRWKKGGYHKTGDAQIVGSTLEAIQQQHGVIKPSVIVDEARDESSPLHSFFDWSDDEAADKWRLWQARNLIGSITVIIDGNPDPPRGFVNVSFAVDEEQNDRGYMSVQQVRADNELSQQFVFRMQAQISSWRRELDRFMNIGQVQTLDATLAQAGQIAAEIAVEKGAKPARRRAPKPAEANV